MGSVKPLQSVLLCDCCLLLYFFFCSYMYSFCCTSCCFVAGFKTLVALHSVRDAERRVHTTQRRVHKTIERLVVLHHCGKLWNWWQQDLAAGSSRSSSLVWKL